MLPNDAEAAWQLTPTASVYLVVDMRRAGGGVLTLITDDLDGSIAQVTARGMTPGRFIDVPGAGRKCQFADPDGNAVSLVELVAAP